MNASKSIAASLTIGILAICGSASADGERGKIKICRLSVPGSAGNEVYIPADGDYGGACHEDGSCRQITVGVTAGGILKGSPGACTTLDAVLQKGDGQPVGVGETLIPHWNTGSLVSHTSVVQAFK